MPKKVCLIFYSRSGNTKKIANRIVETLNADSKDIEINIMDAEKEYNLEVVKKADGYIIGTPDYFSYPAGLIKRVFDDLYDIRSIITDRPAFAFVSHGGGGKAVKPLSELIKSVKLKEIGSIISVRSSDINSKVEDQIKKNCKDFISALK
jgi:flavorubredoxin